MNPRGYWRLHRALEKYFQSVALEFGVGPKVKVFGWHALATAPSPPEPKTLSFITAHRLEGESFGMPFV